MRTEEKDIKFIYKCLYTLSIVYPEGFNKLDAEFIKKRIKELEG